MNLGDIELGDLAAVCAALAVYMDKCVGGRGSRPPLGKSVYVWLGKKLLGIDSFGGRWTLRENWRSIWTSNGFDPSTRKVEQPESFELAVRKLTLRKERLNEIKDERRAKRNGESAETDQPDTEASSARNQDDAAAPMLRQIQRRLGPKQGKLKPLAASLNRPPQPPDATTYQGAGAEEAGTVAGFQSMAQARS